MNEVYVYHHMSSEATNFDFTTYEGKVVDNVYIFPTLSYDSKNEQSRIYNVYIKLINKNINLDNIDISEAKAEIIKPSYMKNELLPANIIACLYTMSGLIDGKHTIQKPKIYDKIMNIGKKNQRNQFQTALIAARKIYTEKQKAIGDVSVNDNWYYPMLATKKLETINYPAYIQPKIDGGRCVMHYDNNEILSYSRDKNPIYDLEHIKIQLEPVFKKYRDLYLDGELYIHGESLQTISGKMRAKKNEIKKDKKGVLINNGLEYWIYDCFIPNKSMIFNERLLMLVDINKMLKDITEKKYLKIVQTYPVKNYVQTLEYYNKFLALGFEGAILRNIQGVYPITKIENSSLRSDDLVKVKPRETEEFEIVGFTEAGSTHKGAIIWKCKTKEGKEFDVTPNGGIPPRQELYKLAKLDFSKFKGKKLTVDFMGYTEEKLPREAKGIVIRDYE